LRPAAVRLDSGDLDQLSRGVRAILDASGLTETRIFASGDLDEYRIAALLASGAPIDAFGVGTRLATSFDQPALGGIYKLVELETAGQSRATLKASAGKATFPGCKQVWRRRDESGGWRGDIIALAGESGPRGAEPLLVQVMANGQRCGSAVSAGAARERARRQLSGLPPELRTLEPHQSYAVQPSAALVELRDRLTAMQRS